MKEQRLSINALVKLGNLVVDGVIALIVVAYFVGRLGAEAYGLVPWLSSLLVFFTIIPTAVQTAAGRFVTHALGRGKSVEAGRYYGTSSLILIGLGFCGFAVTVGLALLADRFFPFAPEFLGDAQALTLLLGASVCLDIARSGWAVAYFTRQRFDLEYGVMIAGGLVRLTLIIGLSELYGVSLLWLGVGTLAGAILRTVAGWYYARLLLPGMRIFPRTFDRTLLRPLSVFAFDVLIAGVGLIILSQADILIAGWLLGSAAVTMYFCGAKWGLLFRAVIGSFTTVLVPRFTILQAEGKIDQLQSLVRRADRLIMPLGWLMACLLFALARPLILTWVGPEQSGAVNVLRVIAFPMAITVSAYVSISLLIGIGQIRESSLSALVIALINPALSIFAVIRLEWGIIGIALASAICLTARNGLYLPLLVRRYAQIPLATYYRRMIVSALAALPSLASAYLAAQYVDLIGWGRIVPATVVCSLPSLAIILLVIAQPEDRRLLRSLLPFYRHDPALPDQRS